MQAWVKIVPVEETTPEGSYFITKGAGVQGLLLWSRYLNGKTGWSTKPGIAMRFEGGPGLVEAFKKNAGIKLEAVEVPPDASRRWKRRVHPRNRS